MGDREELLKLKDKRDTGYVLNAKDKIHLLNVTTQHGKFTMAVLKDSKDDFKTDFWNLMDHIEGCKGCTFSV